MDPPFSLFFSPTLTRPQLEWSNRPPQAGLGGIRWDDVDVRLVLSCSLGQVYFHMALKNREIGFESIDAWIDGIDLIWIAMAEKGRGIAVFGHWSRFGLEFLEEKKKRVSSQP